MALVQVSTKSSANTRPSSTTTLNVMLTVFATSKFMANTKVLIISRKYSLYLGILKGFVMVKLRKGKSVSGPSSSIGLMRFFDAETKGPKITPEFVVAVSVAVAVIWIVILQFYG